MGAPATGNIGTAEGVGPYKACAVAPTTDYSSPP